MRIYTKFGDEGDTRLLAGQTTRKSDLRVELCGQLDELNAAIGVVRAGEPGPAVAEQLARIQSSLLDAGAGVAALGGPVARPLPQVTDEDIGRLELSIDSLQAQLPELKNFILPGGHPTAARLHLARTVCRRCERWLVRLVDEYPEWAQAGTLMAYLNRLGDWLFVAARISNAEAGSGETTWKADAKKP